MTITHIPTIPGKSSGIAYHTVPTQINNNLVLLTSVVIVNSQTEQLSITAFKMTGGSFFISIANEADDAFTAGSCVFNFVIL